MHRNPSSQSLVLFRLALLPFLAGAVGHAWGAAAPALRTETIAGWDGYVAQREGEIEQELSSSAGFLASDHVPHAQRQSCRAKLQSGEVCIIRDQRHESARRRLRHGMIHHWTGSVVVKDANVDDLVRWLQEYDQHDTRFLDVDASEILTSDGERFRIFLRLRRKKVVTVHYNTIHDVEYRRHSPTRLSSRSVASRIAQLENQGRPEERERTPGEDNGFLWRWRSYWRFQQVGADVIVECESISLSRSIPRAFRWMVSRFVESVPRQALTQTLRRVAGF